MLCRITGKIGSQQCGWRENGSLLQKLPALINIVEDGQKMERKAVNAASPLLENLVHPFPSAVPCKAPGAH